MSRCALWVLLACSVPGWCQAPPATPPQQPEPAPIKVQVNEVIVPVTVTDAKGAFISNLDRGDFKVYENGKEQKVAYFSREHNQPVVVGFLLDLSNSSRLHWKNFQDSAMELVWALLSDDRQHKYSGFLVTYATEAELAVNTTPDPEPIADRIRKLKPGGASAMLDAIVMGITRHALVKGEPIEPRRVLVIIGSGQDSASKHTVDQVIELAQRNLVTVYAISTQAFGFTDTGTETLQRLAGETGGRVVFPLENVYKDVSGYLSKPQDAGNYSLTVGSGEYAAAVVTNMFHAIADISGEVTTQYVLRYRPEAAATDQTYRTIRVDVNLPEVKVRARKGYYPFAP
jgi:VWFA-related protein